MANEITMYKGDSQTITVTVTGTTGAAFDLTGYTMRMAVKAIKTATDTNAVITKTATIAAPASGIGVFNLLPSETDVTAGKYFYDVQINSGTTTVSTVVSSTFDINEDVTKTVS